MGNIVEFPDFYSGRLSPKAEAELEILSITSFRFQARFVGQKQIVQAIGHGIVEEGWDPEKPLRHQKDPFHKDLQFQILSQVYASKVADSKDQNHQVSNGRIASNP